MGINAIDTLISSEIDGLCAGLLCIVVDRTELSRELRRSHTDYVTSLNLSSIKDSGRFLRPCQGCTPGGPIIMKMAHYLLKITLVKPTELFLGLRAPVGLGGTESKLDGASQMLGVYQLGVLVASQRIKHSGDEPTSIVGIGLHMAHNHLNGYILGRPMPTIVVSRHADHLVGDLGFASQLGFR